MRYAPFVVIGSLAACGSVELPREQFWRLDLPATAASDLPQRGVLRVGDLQLGNSLSGDCLVVASGPSKLETCDYDHWVAPLDRLVTDAFVLGLSRTRLWALVKSSGDGGGEDYTLNGRILDFSEQRASATSPRSARASFSFWIENRSGLVFADEFRTVVAIHESGPEGAVRALSQAVQQVVDELSGRMRTETTMQSSVNAEPPAGR
jgi:uncharacterized lipoprotein YmbA